jgi:hypothetical protein
MLAMLWIAILGGLLIMMGQQDRSEALFYYFRLEDQFLRIIYWGSLRSTSAWPSCGKTKRELERYRTAVD